MKLSSKRFVVGLVIVVAGIAAGYVATMSPTEEPVSVTVTPEDTPEIYRAPVEERTVRATSTAELVVTVVDETALEEDGLSPAEAMVACEAIAYNPDHMWKQVVCTYRGEEIYNDIFIAG